GQADWAYSTSRAPRSLGRGHSHFTGCPERVTPPGPAGPLATRASGDEVDENRRDEKRPQNRTHDAETRGVDERARDDAAPSSEQQAEHEDHGREDDAEHEQDPAGDRDAEVVARPHALRNTDSVADPGPEGVAVKNREEDRDHPHGPGGARLRGAHRRLGA